MSKMLADEIQVVKAVSIEVDPNTVLVASLQYHTESSPDTGKVDRSKSMYRWSGFVMTKDALKAEIQNRMSDENRLKRGKWLNEKLSYYFCIGNDSTNSTIANWLNLKMKKIVPWEMGQKFLKGWKNKTSSTAEGFYPNAAYRIDGYVCDDGAVVSLDDKEALLKHVNQTMTAPWQSTKKSAS